MATVYGTNNSETINGLDGVTFGDDAIYGYGGDDSIWGLGGDDYIFGGTGADALHGGTGSDTASYDTSTAGIIASLSYGVGAAQGRLRQPRAAGGRAIGEASRLACRPLGGFSPTGVFLYQRSGNQRRWKDDEWRHVQLGVGLGFCLSRSAALMICTARVVRTCRYRRTGWLGISDSNWRIRPRAI
jgi:Ca2+-binding RTX toxin-like protein